VLFVSDSLGNRRKGFGVLIEALSRLSEIPNLFLLSIGGGSPSVPSSVRHLHLGRVDLDEELASIYSAADLFVLPSLEEAFGQTALEAHACGTPAIGFNAGGVADAIRDGVTGLLVRSGDATALANGIAELLADPDRLARMGAAGRAVVLQEHTLEIQARQYQILYSRMLSATADRGS
jgi:glycosyltransferase involved in cell wall biosynthesis